MKRILAFIAVSVAISSISVAQAADEETPKSKLYASSQEFNLWSENAFDGDQNTVWQSAWWHRDRKNPPHELKIELPEHITVDAVEIVCDKRVGRGMVKDYELIFEGESIRGTHDGGEIIRISELPDRDVRSISFKVHNEQKGLPWISIAEMRLIGASKTFPIADPDEGELKRREDRRLRGFAPPNKDSSIEMLDLAIRSYYMLESEGVNVRNFSGQLQSFVDNYKNRERDSRYREEIARFRRDMVLSHPKLNFSRLLINKRRPPGYSHQCDQYLGRHSREGVGLCVLEDWKRNPRCRVLLEGKLPKGDYRHPDLSYDGRKIAFAFCDNENYNGNEKAFFLYECDTNGGGLRQLTGGDNDDRAGWENRASVVTEDFDPCYLPNGEILFISTRSQTYGRCHGSRYVPTYLVYRCDRDGKNIRQLSYGEANEWDPSVLNNGRIVYTRWDYINRHDVRYQSLWTMMPDGTGVAHYHGNYSASPCLQGECKSIPGTNKTVFTAAAHHSYTSGSIMTCDPVKGEDGWAPLGRVTPEAQMPECSDPYHSGGSVAYCSPWPISENLYFAARLGRRQAWQGGRDNDDDMRYEIYLIDSMGGRELIYKDDSISCFAPIPLDGRQRTQMMPSRLDLASKEDTGVFYVQNVYDCRQPIEPGTARMMRINRIHGQTTRGKPWLSTANNEILKNVVGYVPINGDGSVAFRAPAGVPLQLQVCDENGMAVMTMRSFVFLHKGEMASCTGCHEPRESAPTTAFNYGRIRVHDPQKQAGPIYDGGFSFQKTVQPVLDRYCIGCHGLKNDKPKGIDLLGERDGNGFRSYNSLVSDQNRVKVAYRNRETAYSVPKEYYAHAGTLAAHLMSEEHQKHAKLDSTSLRRIVDWLDLNAQCFGDYSHNRIHQVGYNGDGERELREAIKERFGDELSRQPMSTLVNIAQPDESRILMATLSERAGGWGQVSQNAFGSKNDSEYKRFVELVAASINTPSHYDVRGTCGRSHGCGCGNCGERRIDERWRYPPVERNFRTDNGGDRPKDGSYEVEKEAWRLVSVDSEETNVADLSATKAFDGDERTYWCTEFKEQQPLPPHEIVIDLGGSHDVCTLRLAQRDGIGSIKECEIYVSDNPNNFGDPVEQIRFNAKHDTRTVNFGEAKKGRYIKIKALSEWHDGLYTAIRELWVYALPEQDQVAAAK